MMQCKTITVLCYLLIIQLRFIKEHEQHLLQTIRLFISEWDGRRDSSDNSRARRDVVWSISAGDRGELSCAKLNGEWKFMRNIASGSVPFWLVLLTEHEVVHCYSTNARCLVAGQLYPFCPFSSTDFQVSNLSQAIHSTAFVHHIPLWQIGLEIKKKIRIASSCEIFMILFFYWYRPTGLDSFPK